LLVNGQAQPPAWAAGDSRIVMVDRCTLFPRKSDCPTKNTAACEAVIHRIPGLTEHFVNMEDDWILLRKMSPSDFFSASGRPQYAVPVSKDSLMDMYGRPWKSLSGPDMPPDHVPHRLKSFARTHRAMPMTISFSMRLDKEFPDWFAFVRSHKTRFVCCNASTFGNDLDEMTCRMYPAMLYKYGAGDQLQKPALYGAACSCKDRTCIKRTIASMGSIAIQDCGPRDWRFARSLLVKAMQNPDRAQHPIAASDVGLDRAMETSEGPDSEAASVQRQSVPASAQR